jgi:DNA-binding NarL/FixJ family response regulator
MRLDNMQNVTFRDRKLAVIDAILDSRDRLTPREWGIVQLYFKCGLSHAEIARIFKTCRPSITRSMRNIRRKALG